LLADFYDIDHRSSGKEDYFIVFDSAIDDLDDSSYIGSECSDKYSAFYSFDDAIKRLTDDFF